jgi:PAS domain S-box-containing protein
MIKKLALSVELDGVSSTFPVPYYCLDLDQRYLCINAIGIEMIGTRFHEKDFLGRTPYDMYPKNVAETIVQHHREVIQTKKILVAEELMMALHTAQVKWFSVTIAPLKDRADQIIGTIATLVDITSQKREADHANIAKVFAHLQMVAQILPTPAYWLDINQKYLGVNDLVVKRAGATSYELNFANKTPYDLFPEEMANIIVSHHKEVIRTGQILSAEEIATEVSTGELIYLDATIAPLRDDDGKIIGTIGISIDITKAKEAEHLKLENAMHKTQLEAQEKFTKTANQVAHDIRSPLASLLMIIKACNEIPEMERIALREAAISIGDIANNLLNQYKEKEQESPVQEENRQPMLLSVILLQMLTEKKFQYDDLPVKFDYEFSEAGQFACIQVEASPFKRMMSNLINNAVDVFENKEGAVTIKLEATAERVRVTVSDNGKGMSQELVDKILNKIEVTEGKVNGHGLGLMQVHEALEQNNGTLSIQSQLGKGTHMILEFPRVEAPSWIADEIKIGLHDIVIILDDDSSIHMAWDARFESIIEKAPGLVVHHFEVCQEAIDFINRIPEADRDKIYLLTDFELLKQDLNGLHVVEKTGVKRSVLVTSHYVNAIVRERAIKIGTKILPKQLASEIPIIIDDGNEHETQKNSEGLRIVDLVLVDDNRNFANTLIDFVFDQDVVDYYFDPRQFLAKLDQYPKNTRIYLDNNYSMVDTLGIEIAKDLHDLGFTRLYVLSGDTFKPEEIPSYLTVILKTQIDKIRDW